MPASRISDRAGFTLLEVIVATVILAVGLSVALRIFSEGFMSVGRIDLAYRAMNHAENLMNEILSDEAVMGPTSFSGDLDQDFSYSAVVNFWQEPGGEMLLSPVEPRVELLSVVVDVHFKNDIRGKIYRAICLKTVPTEAALTSRPNSRDAIRRLFGARQ